MKEYRLCIANTKKIIDDSDNLEFIKIQKQKYEKLSEIDNSNHNFLIYNSQGKLID